MRAIALSCLIHDRGKLVTAILGVALSATLSISQLGLHAGFRQACSAMIRHAGGDLWVMSRDTRVFDNGRVLPAGTRMLIAEHPCVARVRAISVAWTHLQTSASQRVHTFVVGFDGDDEHVLPWSLERGLPSDLRAPLRVSLDRFDLEKFGLKGDPIGTGVSIDGQPGQIAAITRGIKTFTLTPYAFASIETVRSIANMTDEQSTYFVVDLKDRACSKQVAHWVEQRRNLQARTSAEFEAGSEEFWMAGSGAGPVLTFGTLLGLLVGGAIMAQTLFAMTRDHIRELAVLKALGGARSELAAFVAWQAGCLALIGGLLGMVGAFGLRALAEVGGLNIVLSLPVVALSLTAVGLVCVLSSLLSLRAMFDVDPASVFR